MKTLYESILSSTESGRFGMDNRIRKCDFDAQFVKSLEKEVAFYKPNNNKDLINLIRAYIKFTGNNCSLNWIDVSEITDMSYMFLGTKFNGDISKWDVSNVTKMTGMFYNSSFNGNISEWDVSNVKNMACMFDNSGFNGNISDWDVSNVRDMDYMFYYSEFNGNISKWDVKNVKRHTDIFINCPIKPEYKPKFK